MVSLSLSVSLSVSLCLSLCLCLSLSLSNPYFDGFFQVTYELKDTHCNGGGFCCVPGSHNGHIKLPSEWTDMSSPINLDAEWLYAVGLHKQSSRCL